MAKLIGTAGHVDHGKTALIRALTGIDADRLPEEKRRGMTIDIGFAYVDLERHGRVSIVDVPGHERFLTNMLVGALGIDVALLCVAADESVMPQTREHVEILDLLPVERMVVAMTRADLADPELRAICRLEIEEMLSRTRFAGSTVVETSATTREGIPELRRALETLLDGPGSRDDGAWYLPVDRAFVVKGHGTVVTGTLARGTVYKGDEGVVVPGGRPVRVRGIQAHDVETPLAEAGMRVALNLGGVRLEDVRRGCAVGAPGSLFETSCLDATVRWLHPPKHGMRIRASIGAEEAIGRVYLSEVESEIAQLRLESPVACAVRQPLIVRRYSPQDLLGGGRVAVPEAKPRRRSESAVLASAGSLEEAVLSVVSAAGEGVPTEEICRVLGRTPQDLGSTFESLKGSGKLFGFAGLWLTPSRFEECAHRLERALHDLHEAEPTRSTQTRERALKHAGLRWSGKPLDRIIAALAESGRLVSRGTEIAHPEFRVRLNARQAELLDRVVAELQSHGASVPGGRDLAQLLAVPIQAVEEILRLGVQAGRLLRVAEDVHYTTEQVEGFKEAVRRLGRAGRFTAAEFRDELGTTRKYAIALLEHFDSIRLTTRMGEHRLVQSSNP